MGLFKTFFASPKKSGGKYKTSAKTKTHSSKSAPKNKKKDTVRVTTKIHRDAKGGHHHIIVDDIGSKHVSVGLTTKKSKGKGATNYPLEQSPFNDGKKSFVRRQAIVDEKSNYHGQKPGELTKKDYERVKLYGDRAKQKYLEKNENKKSNGSANAEKHKP